MRLLQGRKMLLLAKIGTGLLFTGGGSNFHDFMARYRLMRGNGKPQLAVLRCNRHLQLQLLAAFLLVRTRFKGGDFLSADWQLLLAQSLTNLMKQLNRYSVVRSKYK